VTTILSSKLVGAFGTSRVLLAGLLGSGVATLLFVLTGQGTSVLVLSGILFFAGAFFGLTVVPLQTAPFRGISQDRMAQGTSILSVIRQLGVAIGTAAVAIPLGQVSGTVGFSIAFAIAGTMSLVAIPLVLILEANSIKNLESVAGSGLDKQNS
jgi:hypothetical protein